jgi:hypothetical protein
MVTLGQLNVCDSQSSNYSSVRSNCLGNWTITQIRESENGVNSVDQRLISMFVSLLVFFKSPGAVFTKLMASCYFFFQNFIYESDVHILFRNVNCHFSIQFLLCCCHHIYWHHTYSIFIYLTIYSKAVLPTARIFKTMTYKSIAYLLLRVIPIRWLHLSTVLVFKIVTTKRTTKQQRNPVLLMLRLLRSHLLRCWIDTTSLHIIDYLYLMEC